MQKYVFRIDFLRIPHQDTWVDYPFTAQALTYKFQVSKKPHVLMYLHMKYVKNQAEKDFKCP